MARLGAVYAEDILGRTRPSIGLLSIGEEASKGNAVVKEANALLVAARREGLNFQGNVEGATSRSARRSAAPSTSSSAMASSETWCSSFTSRSPR